MTEAEIIAAIRRGIREPKQVKVSNTQISSSILRAVVDVGMKIRERDPSYFRKRVSLSSYTQVFAWPSNCLTIENVWDMETTAGTITDATNASPIVITEGSHGRATDDIVLIHDVAGNTSANGTFQITEIDDDSYSLNGSTGNAAYTSGGKVFEETSSMPSITRINLEQASRTHYNSWYPRERNIIVDDDSFTNDIVIDYISEPDAITDIPSVYHDGLVSYGVIDLMPMSAPGSKKYPDLQKSLGYHQGRYDSILKNITKTIKASTEPSFIKNVWSE